LTNNVYVIWLRWPETCFRAHARDIAFFKTLVPRGGEVIEARSERSFLSALLQATHAIVWQFKESWFTRAKRLKVLATPGAGRELVSQNAPRGVALHFGHFHGQVMAESVAGFMLAWSRGFFRPELKKAGWQRVALSNHCYTLEGTRAVIVGYGRVGRAIGEKLAALGVSVKGFGRQNLGGFPDYAREADWVVLALPSDTGTDDFLNARRIGILPRRCVVVNVGRGNAVDEQALVNALRRGRLVGAYLDVFKGEPGPLANIVSGGSDGILRTAPADLPWNLIRTPHASAFTSTYLTSAFQELKNDGML